MDRTTSRWPFVGRVDELDRLTELIAQGAPVVVVGAPGVGKSRLVAEVADRAEAAGTVVTRILASEATRAIPYGALAPLLPNPPAQPRADAVHGAAVVILATRQPLPSNRGTGSVRP